MAGASSVDSQDRRIARIRERAADAERRLDSRPSEFNASLSGLDVSELFSRGRAAADDLLRLLEQGVDDELLLKAGDIEQQMSTPAARPLPAPATEAGLAVAEARLGVVLPPLLRRLYLEVANGGFGPGSGIVGISGGWTTDRGRTIEDLFAEMSDSTTEDPRWVWPAGLVPLVDFSGTFGCVDASGPDGRIVEWDPDELDDGGADRGWSRSFREVAPSLDAWLQAWLDAPAPVDESAELMAQASAIPEVTRQYWIAMTPEQRAEYGLPATGWGLALFGDAWGDDPRDRG
jgi:hypothetical protein